MTVIAAGIGAALAAAVIFFRRTGRRVLVVACILVMAALVIVTAFSRMDDSGEVSSYGVFAFVIVYFALDYRGRKAAEDAAAANQAADDVPHADPAAAPAAAPEVAPAEAPEVPAPTSGDDESPQDAQPC